jgi:hypothetical protein
MTIKDCRFWTEQDATHPPSAGVTLYRTTPGVKISGNGSSTLYSSLAMQNLLVPEQRLFVCHNSGQ